MTDLAFNEKWKNIPREILHIILKYDGKILYRSGGFYMNQIPFHSANYQNYQNSLVFNFS